MNEKESLSNYETAERYYATELFNRFDSIKEYSFTSGRICFDTLIVKKDETRILGEIKVRNFPIKLYNTYILELGKLRGLINRANQNKCSRIYYINFFLNETHPTYRDCIIFDLTPRLIEWKTNPPKVEHKYMNRMTCVSTTNKISKDVIMLEYRPELDCKVILALN
jgi:hypothetical protein